MAKQKKSLMQQACGVFKGPMKGWAWLALLFALIFTVGFFYSGWQFMQAESLNAHFHWGVALLLSALFIAMLKIWFWLQMVKNEIIETLKK